MCVLLRGHIIDTNFLILLMDKLSDLVVSSRRSAMEMSTFVAIFGSFEKFLCDSVILAECSFFPLTLLTPASGLDGDKYLVTN